MIKDKLINVIWQVLAKKMTVLYKLAKEQLSKQNHYDFGLRALKSVLVMAGELKRGSPDLPENVVLMRALRLELLTRNLAWRKCKIICIHPFLLWHQICILWSTHFSFPSGMPWTPQWIQIFFQIEISFKQILNSFWLFYCIYLIDCGLVKLVMVGKVKLGLCFQIDIF